MPEAFSTAEIRSIVVYNYADGTAGLSNAAVAKNFDAWLETLAPDLEGVVPEGAITRVVDYRQNLINIAEQIENELVPALRSGGLPSEPVEDGAKLFREVVEDLRKVLANIPLQTFAVVAEDPRLGGGRSAFGQQL